MQSRTFEMTTRPSRLRLPIAGLAALAMLLAGPPVRAAFLPLPASGAQVNDDPANSIDASQDAGVSDVAGGTVRAGNITVPWATFEQKVAAGAQQIFVRAFKSGAWVTQGPPRHSTSTRRRRPRPRRSTSPVRDARSRGSPGTSRARPPAGRRTSSPAASTRRPTPGCPPARAAARSTCRLSTSTPFARPRTPRSRAVLPSPATIRFPGSPGRRTTASRMTARRCGRSSWRRR